MSFFIRSVPSRPPAAGPVGPPQAGSGRTAASGRSGIPAGSRPSALACVLALLAGLVAVLAAPAPAVALPAPQDTRVATQNMQRKTELWGARVALLAQNFDVVALQEVPWRRDSDATSPSHGWMIPRPPDRPDTAIVRLTDRGPGQLLPALPSTVTEYRWNTGTFNNPHWVFLYLMRTSSASDQNELPVGMITSERVWNALDVHHPAHLPGDRGSARNALVLLDDQHRMAYASYHADAYPNNHGHRMVERIAAEVTAVGNQNGGQPWNWTVVGDFNRNPTTMEQNFPQNNPLGAHVIYARDAANRPARTHEGTGEGALDYMVTSAPQNNWFHARTINTHGGASSGSDHFSVAFGGTLQGAAEARDNFVVENNDTEEFITENGLARTPIHRRLDFSRSQIFSLGDYVNYQGVSYFTIMTEALPTRAYMVSGREGTVGIQPGWGSAGAAAGSAVSNLPFDAYLWRLEGDTIRNVHGQRLAIGNDGRVWMHKPVPTEPDRASWQLHRVDMNHRDTAGFPANAGELVNLISAETSRYLRDDPATDKAVEGQPRAGRSTSSEDWFVRPSTLSGTMQLVNQGTKECLTGGTFAGVPWSALTRPCPAATSPATSPEVQMTSWQYVGRHIRNATSGGIVGHVPATSPAQGTNFTVYPGHTTEFDVTPAILTHDPGELRKLAVMPLGDSITLGVGSGARTGYRPALAQMLAQDAPDVRFVGSMQDADGTRHEGHSGWRIDQISANIDRWMADAKPNLVLLHIGTNDMNRNHEVATAPQRLAGLIDQIHASSPQTAIVVASLVPAADRTVQSRVDAYNRAIPGIVAERAQRGSRITQVSMGTLTVADLDDNLHPNDSGYRKMAASFHGGVVTAARNKWIDENVTVKPAPPGSGSPAAAGDYRVDINGDGRSDYLVVEDNGAVRAWTSSTTATGTVKWTDQGVIASGSAQWTGEQVRFADVGGDARADYLVLSPNGAVRAFVNTGGDGRGGWRDDGIIASGSTAWNSSQVRFADIGGDAKADYLIVSDRGAVRAFIHSTTATGTVKWTDQGTVATGSTRWTAEDVRFADITGDAKADYLIVGDTGATQVYTNSTTATGTVKWTDEGTVATGSTRWTGEQVRFADVTGDARADYLVLAPNGALTAYENIPGTGDKPVHWEDLGTIATGTGSPAVRVRI
ncbi:GDSL-type esterase/lipase family protein [Streptomyces sp. NPDC057638]|uniref:GDSL-type esterase/lipase family protein n=1 Tax=Streptomyces sp. NPDC057638 TaxID=3346190 RepID=UPI0036B99621